jgi:hypothetical protein
MMKKSILFIFILSAVLLGQNVGTEAPDFTYETLDHGTISLSDYRGRVVYLFFFGWN